MLMSDAGGGTDVSGLAFSIDDDAPGSIPDSGPLAATSYKPTNIFPTDDGFPAPAPVPWAGSALSLFNGADPNGTWRIGM